MELRPGVLVNHSCVSINRELQQLGQCWVAEEDFFGSL